MAPANTLAVMFETRLSQQFTPRAASPLLVHDGSADCRSGLEQTFDRRRPEGVGR